MFLRENKHKAECGSGGLVAGWPTRNSLAGLYLHKHAVYPQHPPLSTVDILFMPYLAPWDTVNLRKSKHTIFAKSENSMLSAGVIVIMGSTSQPSLGLQQWLCQGERRLVPTCSASEPEGRLVSHSLPFMRRCSCTSKRAQKHFEYSDLKREKNFHSCPLEEALFIQWVFIALLRTKSPTITVSCCSERKSLRKQ